MATSPLTFRFLFLFLLLSFFLSLPSTTSHPTNPSTAIDWPLSMYNDFDGIERNGDLTDIIDGGDDDDGEGGDEFGRRSLFWRRTHYYISYGALSANRVPCPPRSGRSYYSHQCFRARGPVRPYTRDCSMITRCRR